MESSKIYYSMREVIAETGLAASNLRYWEAQFEQLNPRKDGHGNRYYTRKDIDLIQRIKYIRDEMKITRIEAIQKELNAGTKQSDVKQQAATILQQVRQELEEIRSLI